MMSMTSPGRSLSPPPPIKTQGGRRGTTTNGAAAYGTFYGEGEDDNDDEGIRSRAPQRLSPRSNRRLRRSHVMLLRAVGVVGVFLFAASYMLTRSTMTSPTPATAPSSTISTSKHKHATSEEDKPAAPRPASVIEASFLKGVHSTRLREFLHAYASKPHPAGSEQDYQTALYTVQQLESFGIEAKIHPYYPLLSVPKRRRVAIVEPREAARDLDLTETTIESDACTTATDDALPPFLAYAQSGNVTAAVVYANYGRQEDFQWLVDQGIELKGKIALIRYGRNFRGLKVMLAEEHGMVGTLIYSDPQEDGFVHGETYPDGPWRPKASFQRGSAQYLSLYGGDPLTPGYPSTIDAAYLSVKQAKSIPHTPATVLSYEQATHILQALRGTKAPTGWQGGLDLPDGYHIGDDAKTTVNLDLDIDNKIGPIWNVVGTIKGAVEPQHQVIIGNHRDAWVCGAIDPSSGTATLMEIARNLGTLLKNGWRPRRTIKIASWDGEEYGLLGSTEYAEDHEDALLKHAVAYINVDSVFGPMVSAGGTPSIAEFLEETAKVIPPNKFNGDEEFSSLYEQWASQKADAAKANPDVLRSTLEPDHLVSLLGSGTDYTAFYQHLGVISANLAFSNGIASGVYHSNMDSPMYLEMFADPHYSSQATTARWWGLLALRLANDVILPFDFSTYGLVMHKDLTDFEAQTTSLGLAIDYSKLRDAINHFSAHAELFHARVSTFRESYSGESKDAADAVHAINTKLVRLERQFIAKEGLPHRPWYRHVIFGPGFYEGYAGTAFPGIADAIAFRDDAETTQHHVDDVAAIVSAAAEYIVASED